MKLRLWANWEPAGREHGVAGYHLEVDRNYPALPSVGDTIALNATRHGLSKPTIEHIFWDMDGPNLLLGTWQEEDGAELAQLTDAGFHQSGQRVIGCSQCASAADNQD